MTTVALEALGDAWVDSTNPGLNHGADSGLSVGKMYGAVTYRALLRFDLGGIPTSAAVVSATLRLTCSGVNTALADPMDVRLLATDFDESTVTWSNQPAETGTASPTVTAPTAVGAQREFDVAALVALRLGGTMAVVSRYSIENNAVGDFRWASREHATPSWRPLLTVEYTAGGGGGSGGSGSSHKDGAYGGRGRLRRSCGWVQSVLQ